MHTSNIARALALGSLVLLCPAFALAANCPAGDVGTLLNCVQTAASGDNVVLTADISLIGLTPLNVTNNIRLLNGAFNLTGGGGIEKLGAGTLTMGGTNSYAGNTRLTAGTIVIGTASTLPSAVVVLSGGNLIALGSMTLNMNSLLVQAGGGSVSVLAGTTLTLKPSLFQIDAGVEATFGTAGRDGTVVLDANTILYTATSTIRAAFGTLRLGNPGAGASLQFLASTRVDAGATLTLNGNDAILSQLLGGGNVDMGGADLRVNGGTFSGTLTGTSDLGLLSGTLTLTGSSSSVGFVNVNPGATLALGNGGAGGAIAANLYTVGGTVAVNRSDDLDLPMQLSGAGTLRKQGGGTLSLSYFGNALSGNVDIQDGILQQGNGINGSIGTASIANASKFVVNCAVPQTVPNLITGAGAVTIKGGATVTVTNAGNTYSGMTTVTGGSTVAITAATSLGAGDFLAQDGGLLALSTLTYAPGGTQLTGATIAAASGQVLTLAGAHVGAAPLVFGTPGNDGTVLVQGAVSASPASSTTVAFGTLRFGNTAASTLLSAPTTIDAGAVVHSGGYSFLSPVVSLTGAGTLRLAGGNVVELSDGYDFAGTITGDGAVTLGSGTLSGNNDYTERTTVNGSVNVGLGGATGTLGTDVIENFGSIIVNRSGSYTIPSVISGTGSIEKAGPGTLTLSATNTYSGQTLATGGILSIMGSVANSSLTRVMPAGELRGTGVTGALTATGGLVSPGLSPGILNTGDYDMDAASSLVIEINGPAPGTQHDQVSVTGGVHLAGALALTLGYVPSLGNAFTIIANDGADPVVGTFAGLAEGGTLVRGTTQLTISYAGGAGGNDVTLTASGALPGAPTIVSAAPGNALATVTFSAPVFTGGLPILDYTLVCGAVTLTPAASPQLVAGLANGVPVNCVARARNALGTGPDSLPFAVTPSWRAFTAASATGTGAITASFTGGGAACSFQATPSFIPLSSVPAAPPQGTRFPHGLFDFTLVGCDPTPVTMTVTYPAALAANTHYWKYGPTPGQAAHWYTMPAVVAGSTITFTLADGAIGDDDLAVNGIIVDQGGPAIPAPFGAANAVPTISQWMLALMMLVLGFGGAMAVREKRVRAKR